MVAAISPAGATTYRSGDITHTGSCLAASEPNVNVGHATLQIHRYSQKNIVRASVTMQLAPGSAWDLYVGNMLYTDGVAMGCQANGYTRFIANSFGNASGVVIVETPKNWREPFVVICSADESCVNTHSGFSSSPSKHFG